MTTGVTPLEVKIEEVLREAAAPLTPLEIQRHLRRTHGPIRLESITESLERGRTLVTPGEGRWWLAVRLHELAAERQARKLPREQVGSESLPLLRNLHLARENYVVLDLETSGTDPESDAILQIVAIRHVAGIPASMLVRYCNPADRQVSRSLMRKLGLLDRPEVWAAIQASPSFAEIAAEVRAFLGDDPLVAHNARFDAAFLTRQLGEFANPVVDTMELALLIFPELASHRLADISVAAGVTFEEASRIATQHAPAEIRAMVAVEEETLHDAVTDTCLLSLAYRSLLMQWDAQAQSADFWHALLPEAWGSAWSGEVAAPGAYLEEHAPTLPAGWAPSPPKLLDHVSQDAVGAALAAFRRGKGFAERPGQTFMAARVHDALAGGAFGMIEAPTGTGKSLAYLVPAALHAMATGKRVALSTANKTLQDQLVHDLAAFENLSGLPVRYEVLKGLANEICRSALLRAFDAVDAQTQLDERFVLAFLVQWLAACPDADSDRFPYWIKERFPIAAHLLEELTAGEGRCGGKECRHLGCAAWVRAERAKGAHLLLINHALWLADPERLPEFSSLVVDEAHVLEDSTTSVLTEQASLQLLEALLRKIVDGRTGRGVVPRILSEGPTPAVAASARAVLDCAQAASVLAKGLALELRTFIRRASGRHIDPRYGVTYRLEAPAWKIAPTLWPSTERACEQLFAGGLGDLITAVSALADRISPNETNGLLARAAVDLRDIADQLREQQQTYRAVVGATNRHDVHWIKLEVAAAAKQEAREPANSNLKDDIEIRDWAFCKAPIRVAARLQEYYDRLESALLISATLTVGRSGFRYFRDRLGLDERVHSADEHIVPSELDYGRNAFLGLAAFLNSTPSQRTLSSFQDELARELAQFLPFTGGRALGLFTARSRMGEVARRLRDPLEAAGISLLVQHSGATRTSLLEDFRADEQSVLLGVRSFWEGVDVPGDALSFVLMEKLPFPALNDPISAARREDVLARGGNEFEDYLFPLMCLQFKQGFGRLLRRTTDRGAVVLYDKRIHRKGYMGDLLASLPGFVPRDPRVERSRRLFYEAIAEHVPKLIDRDGLEAFLQSLPDSLLTDLEENLAAWVLPKAIPEADYPSVRPLLLEVIRSVFGHEGFRSDAQEQVVREMLAGHDVLGLLPTGAGKSLCFQLTALVSPGVTLVVSPLIALMRDQVASLIERGIEIVGAILGGQGSEEREETLNRLRLGRLKLLYVSPERLRDPALTDALREAHIARIVVDEAHCVSTWGPQFRPDFLRIQRLLDRLDYRPPVAAFTATATPEMRSEIRDALGLVQPREVVARFDRPELHFVVANRNSDAHPIRTKRERLGLLLRILQAAELESAANLVYVSTTVEADLLARRLRAMGLAARAYHGKMDKGEREIVQDLFMDDQITTVVCTKAFGMGIDKPDIRYVIHAQMPGDLESYYQEAGRAGRDGQPAWCILLNHQADRRLHEYFIDQAAPSSAAISRLLQTLRALSANSSGQAIVVAPEELAEAVGLDETQLNVLLYQFEKVGLVVREDDVSAKASLTLRDELSTVCAMLGKEDSDAATLVTRLATSLGWEAYERYELDLPETASSVGMSVSEIDQALLRLAAMDLALYRPFRKAIHLAPTGRLMDAGAAELLGAIADPRPAMEVKLAAMEQYTNLTRRIPGSGASGVACRRAVILNYFGDTLRDGGCGACDLCCPGFRYPWSSVTERDVAGVADFFDPAMTMLETVQWNEERGRRGRAVYGLSTLRHVLLGNAWDLTRFEADPVRRKARLATLRACPYWGVFEALENGDRQLDATVVRLEQEGFLAQAMIERVDGASYLVPVLTAKALAQLESGEVLAWRA